VVENIDELLTKEEQKYLAALYRASEMGNSRVSTTALSQQLRLHPSTVSNKIKSLKDLRIDDYKIIDYEKSYGVKLTYHGIIIGGKIIRQIRIKELFLKSLGFDLIDIEKEAEEMHCSERVAKRVQERIIEPLMRESGNSELEIRCPHGALVPDENGRVINEMFYPLHHFPSQSELTIHRILFLPDLSDARYFLREIQKHSLFPGTKIVSGDLNSNLNKISLINGSTSEEFEIPTQLADLLYCTDQNYVYVIP